MPKSHVLVQMNFTNPSVLYVCMLLLTSGMRKLRIDQDFLIEHWHMIYLMSVVFAESYV